MDSLICLINIYQTASVLNTEDRVGTRQLQILPLRSVYPTDNKHINSITSGGDQSYIEKQGQGLEWGVCGGGGRGRWGGVRMLFRQGWSRKASLSQN